jgi:hypothetical protein
MPFIVWLKHEESMGLKVSRGQVAFTWTGPPGLDEILKACPRRGPIRDLLILCEDVLTLPVHLPILPGREPGDREALKESLRWEAEPLLGYSPAGAPFDYTAGSPKEGPVGGSEWWVTSIEPTVFEAWKQACKETRFKLRAAMDPWTALASCLPDGSHLLIHKRCVILAVLKSQRIEVFKTWQRPPEIDPENTDWMDEVLGSSVWSGLQEEVILWDLCDNLEPAEMAQILNDRSGIKVRPTKLKGNGMDPWCHLLAASTSKLMKGRSPLPAARPEKDQKTLRSLEGAIYAGLGVLLIAALLFWYYADSSTVNHLKTQIQGIKESLTSKENASTPLNHLKAENAELAEEVRKMAWNDKESSWHRRLPGDFVYLMNQLRTPDMVYHSVMGWANNAGYQMLLKGETRDPNSIFNLADSLEKAGLGLNHIQPNVNPTPSQDGSFTLKLHWVKPSWQLAQASGKGEEHKRYGR